MADQNNLNDTWKKNLDKRYISGEDLKNGVLLGKGLRPEMVVTLARWEDSPTFDKNSQSEEIKTALWLKEYPSGKMLYKPVILNVTNADFLFSEIGNGSVKIADADHEKPFVLYARPDKRHGFVARFKKYYPKSTANPDRALSILAASKNLEDLQKNWSILSKDEQALPAVMAKKNEMKGRF